MRARALGRAVSTVTAALIASTLLAVPSQAAEVDPAAPVVVDDVVTMWPGQYTEINVLANDSDPAGDELTPCWLPTNADGQGRTPVAVLDLSAYGEPLGTLAIGTRPRARGTHTISYYVCSHSRLTPATLTVKIRPVAPVEVVPAHVPGRILVTNNNDRRIQFLVTDRTGCRIDTHGFVAAHATRSFAVHRHIVKWFAGIGRGGVAGHGVVRDIPLTGPAAPPGPHNTACLIGFGFFPKVFAGRAAHGDARELLAERLGRARSR